MQPELVHAFTTALTGNFDTIIDWRVINDRNKSDQGRNLRGTVTEILPALQQYNEAGWGIFICINALDGQGQKLLNVAYIRTHVVDLDDPLCSHASYEQAVNSSLPPHITVQSSPDKYHLYWFVQPYTGNDFYTKQQRKFAQLHNGDKMVVDATRVMRVPGFNHCKNEPILSTCWSVSNNPRYTSEQIEAHLQNVNIIEHIGSRSPLGTKKMAAPSLEWATFALNLREPNELDRDEWRASSAAFKQAAWNFADEQLLLNIWEQWCARYKENDPGENLKLWNSFKDTQVGWSHFRRVTVIDAHLNNAGVVKPSDKTPEKPTPDPIEQKESEFAEILDTESKKRWFKNCFFIEQFGKIFSSTARFMNSTQFNGKYGGKQFCMSTAGSKVVDEAWKAALRATDWTIPKVDHIRFLPEEKPYSIVKDSLGRKGLNTYIIPKIEMHEGDVTLWLIHLKNVLPDENDRNIFCSYLAHCVKFPGYKIPWAILFQSLEGGGKTMIKDVVQHALGEMYTYSPNAKELAASGSKFNAWMRSKLAIIVDEIRVDERRDLIEVLKPMITDLRVEVQSKGVDQEMEDNPANWIFFTNHKDAIPVSQNGRRYCVFFSPLQTEQQLLAQGMNTTYFNILRKWYLHNGGIQAITWWLMNYPIERGSLPGRAPHTTSHAEALRIGRSPLEVLLDQKIANNEYGFKNGYVSFTMLMKAIENSRMRTPPEYVVKTMLQLKNYYELGHYTRILTNEDFGKPPLLFALDRSSPVENYEYSQQ